MFLRYASAGLASMLLLLTGCGQGFDGNLQKGEQSFSFFQATSSTMPMVTSPEFRNAPASAYEDKGINFGSNNDQADFDGDGFLDDVVCRHGRESSESGEMVTIIYSGDPGKTGDDRIITKKNIYAERVGDRDHLKLVFGGCDIAYLEPGKPSIVYAVHRFSTLPGGNNRHTAPAKVLLNLGGGKFKVRTIQFGDNHYYVNGRDVTCTNYPQRLIDNGHGAPGTLCFFAGYDAGTRTAGYGTATAILKLEKNGDQLIQKDLTPTSGTMWHGGVNGTAFSFANFPCFQWPSGVCGLQGVHVMGGAFLDYNADGLPDLIPAIKHSGQLSYTMQESDSQPEGIYFQRVDIARISGPGEWSEYMKVVAMNEIDTGINMPCVYFSGEYNGSPDHVRCYESGAWKLIRLPITLSSQNAAVATRFGGNGKVVIKAGHSKYFDIPYRGILKGASWRVNRSKKVIINGWACEENSDRAVKIQVYMKKITDPNKVLLGKLAKTDRASSQNVRKKCLQPKDTTKSFKIELNKADLPGGTRNVYVYATLKKTNQVIQLSHFKYKKSGGVVEYFNAQ